MLRTPHSRRYQIFRYGRYPIPNDDEEINRELLKHVMFKDMLNGALYLAPIGKNPQKIIDLGTGSGEWAIEGQNPFTFFFSRAKKARVCLCR